jgi:hypothetical protein
MAECYHRSRGGKVTFIDAMTRDEVEEAIERAPWEWATSPRGFARLPADRVRGDPVEPPSLADTAKPSADPIWKRA